MFTQFTLRECASKLLLFVIFQSFPTFDLACPLLETTQNNFSLSWSFGTVGSFSCPWPVSTPIWDALGFNASSCWFSRAHKFLVSQYRQWHLENDLAHPNVGWGPTQLSKHSVIRDVQGFNTSHAPGSSKGWCCPTSKGELGARMTAGQVGQRPHQQRGSPTVPQQGEHSRVSQEPRLPDKTTVMR